MILATLIVSFIAVIVSVASFFAQLSKEDIEVLRDLGDTTGCEMLKVKESLAKIKHALSQQKNSIDALRMEIAHNEIAERKKGMDTWSVAPSSWPTEVDHKPNPASGRTDDFSDWPGKATLEAEAEFASIKKEEHIQRLGLQVNEAKERLKEARKSLNTAHIPDRIPLLAGEYQKALERWQKLDTELKSLTKSK